MTPRELRILVAAILWGADHVFGASRRDEEWAYEEWDFEGALGAAFHLMRLADEPAAGTPRKDGGTE